MKLGDMMLTPAQLSSVIGGADPASFGRCGPDNRWKWLGDVRTPACAAHDKKVRSGLDAGQSKVEAHARALPKLPAAIGSWVGAKIGL